MNKIKKSMKAGDSTAAAKKDGTSPAKLNRDIQAKLGDQLRQMYNDVVSQGVPDRFADLLARLDQPEATNGDKSV